MRGIADRHIIEKVRFGMLTGRFTNFINNTSNMGLIPEKDGLKEFSNDGVEIKADGTGIY